MQDLATKHDVDVLCLQETKLQEMHVTDPKLKLQGYLLEEEGYSSTYHCATAKKVSQKSIEINYLDGCSEWRECNESDWLHFAYSMRIWLSTVP